jgi:rubrerythrin
MTASAMPVEEPGAFYDGLVAALRARRAELEPSERNFGADRALSRGEVLEWLKFQAWYELQAVRFIGAWLAHATEDDALQGLARQIGDEARHYRLFNRHLESLGATLSDWQPEPEWVTWVCEFYASGDDTLERVAAHNITGELGAFQAFESMRPRVPLPTRRVIEKVMPDEKFHIALGRTIVRRYATTADAQARVRARVWRAFELEQVGRAAYERRVSALRDAA